jgi:molybdenum cofactor guanylyltransferase
VTAAAAPAAAFDAIVLAGGRATRLGGVDKPSLVVGQSTLLSSVVSAAVAAGVATVVVVGPPRPELALIAPGPPGGLRSVCEDPPGAGPVAALRRGLAEVRAPSLLLLAADLPFLRGCHIRLLLAEFAGAGDQPAGGVMSDFSETPQWLISCWRTARLRAAAAGYRGSSLHGLLRPLQPVVTSFRPAAGAAPPWLDCDTAADLRAARAWQQLAPAAEQPGDDQDGSAGEREVPQ